MGQGAGININVADNVICIGAAGNDVNDSCFIGNIFGATSSGGTAVLVNSNGRLGTVTSSARSKDEIKPRGKASEAILALRPVSFRYKKQIDPQELRNFGLVAGEVEKVNPDLIVRDAEGRPYTVRYEAINAMLLNEFLKEHRKVQEEEVMITQLKSTVTKQQSAIAQQRKDLEATISELKRKMQTVVARFEGQDAKIQNVSDQVGMGKSTAQRILNDQ